MTHTTLTLLRTPILAAALVLPAVGSHAQDVVPRFPATSSEASALLPAPSPATVALLTATSTSDGGSSGSTSSTSSTVSTTSN